MKCLSPRISNDINEQHFNNSVVSISWSLPEDPYLANVNYEIEYTTNYSGPQTLWHTINKRIPSYSTTYEWIVGKMIKSSSVRVRIRSKNSLGEFSDWSISGNFSVNVFKLSPPTILSPIADSLYFDFILIILDESLLINTYNQKVRYTFEYSSVDQNIGWTTIAKDVIPGRGVIRWNIESLPSSNDYVLRLIAKNTSCLSVEDNPNQYAVSYVYGIRIRQSGMFIIDTKPPEAVLGIDGKDVSNQLHQVINVFSEDVTTKVESIQLRECDASTIIKLGNIDAEQEILEDCPSPETLLLSRPFNKLITDSPIGDHAKVQWTFNALDKNGDPVSALKKIEALLIDSGGNSSLQNTTKVFLSIFSEGVVINDFIVVIEERDLYEIGEGGSTSQTSATFEVVYVGLSNGQLWILEPHPRLIYTIEETPNILKLCEFNGAIYIYTKNSTCGVLYRHNSTFYTQIHEFCNVGSNDTGDMKVYDGSLYIGLDNGRLWKYDGASITDTGFMSSGLSISTLHADDAYLYIGISDSNYMFIYDGTEFTNVVVGDTAITNQIYTRGGNIYALRSYGTIEKGYRPIWDNEYNYLTQEEVSGLNAYDKTKVSKTNYGIKISGTAIKI